MPPETIQQLRQYDRRIFDLDTEIVRKLSKLDGVMQRCNIRLSNYVSNTDSVSYKEVVRALSKGVTDPSELVKHVHGRIINHHGRETIMSCLYGGKGLLCLTLNDAVLFIIDFILPQTISNRFIEKRYNFSARLLCTTIRLCRMPLMNTSMLALQVPLKIAENNFGISNLG